MGGCWASQTGGGSGTVTSTSVVTANGFSGTVASATTTPAITLGTSVNGIAYGNGSALNAVTIGSGLTFAGGTLSASGGGGSAITISNKTSAYTVVSGDAGTVINCTSGTFTISLTAAASLGSGFNCTIWNSGTGAITIDPNAAETIDGVATIVLRQGEGTQIVCNGTNWQTGSKKTMRGYAENCLSTMARPVATSGNNAIAIGNSYASGADSISMGITDNTSSYGATGANSFAFGQLTRSSASGSVSAGSLCVASGSNAVSFGTSCTASASYSIALGNGAQAKETGKFALESYSGYGNGAAQYGTINCTKTTTDATASVLTSDTAAAAGANQLILQNNTAYAFSGIVVARQKAANGTASAAWKIEGLIRREGTAATTTLVASTVTAISNVPAWTLALSADTTNGGLSITATGAAATNIRWLATVQSAEITYA
jgi:hypothetical protein